MAQDMSSALSALMQVPGMQELMNDQLTQQRQLMPLRQGVAQAAANMLPSSAWQTTANGTPVIGSIAPANYTTPPPQDNGLSTLQKILLALSAAGAAGGIMKALKGGNGAESGGNLGNLVKGIQHLFHREEDTSPGNPAYSSQSPMTLGDFGLPADYLNNLFGAQGAEKDAGPVSQDMFGQGSGFDPISGGAYGSSGNSGGGSDGDSGDGYSDT